MLPTAEEDVLGCFRSWADGSRCSCARRAAPAGSDACSCGWLLPCLCFCEGSTLTVEAHSRALLLGRRGCFSPSSAASSEESSSSDSPFLLFAGALMTVGALAPFMIAVTVLMLPASFPFSQSLQTQFVVHNRPAPKHSQYFFLHLERLQRHPLITFNKLPRGVRTSWSWISRSVPLKALGLFIRIFLIASMRFSSCLPSLWQSSHTQSDVQRTLLRKHWQYCFRHFVLPHLHPFSLPRASSPSSSSSADDRASGAGLNLLVASMMRRWDGGAC
jgi:hypothetical protein